ncbi:MAG: T9SS type A sorting domain-containing protein, partial [Candidatus Eisenbacteria sp.]|nr:T9SS type A sorting domain-containing protein [Candidatus Eisenbacteria bacterium]
WMWIDAEESGSYPGRAYDGGLVEVSIDGGPFEQITPVGDYTHTIRIGSTPGPFPENTPVFSGNSDWQAVRFELGELQADVVFRFRFGSDGADVREGWYIDDIEIFGLGTSADIGEEVRQPVRLTLAPSSPNPFGNNTRISFALPETGQATLEVFDASGRLVRTLINGMLPAGSHTAVWRGADDARRPAPSGLYYCRLSTDEGMLKRAVVLLR